MATRELALSLLDPADSSLLNGFSCGDEDLDGFLRDDAARLQVENVAKTYVSLDPSTGELVGYFSLLNDAIHLMTSEKRRLGLASTDHPIVPAIKIARLGVDERRKGGGVGRFLVRCAFAITREVAESTGCRLLTVDAYPNARSFYERLGFIPNRSPNYRDREHPSLRLDVFGRVAPEWL